MPSVRALCNKAMLLQKGRLIAYGNTQEIIAEYFASDYVLRNDDDGIIPEKLSLHNTGEGRFTFAKIMDDENEYKKELYFKQKFSVHFKLQLNKDVEHVIVSVFIVNSYGENVIMANESYKPVDLKKGISEYIVSFNELLMPGNYSIGFAVAYFYSGSSIDHLESVCDFKVIKETKEKDMEYPWATIHGYILPKTTWKKIN